MTILSALDERVTIQRVGSTTTDEWNNPTESVTGTDEYDGRLVPILGRGLASGRETEVLGSRDTIVVEYLLWLQPDAVVAATDRAIVNGHTYEIMGAPAVLRGMGATIHHIEVPVREVVSA